MREEQGRQRPDPRARSGLLGRRFARTGTEPLTAQSALGPRLLLASFFTPLFIAAAVLFAMWSSRTGAGSSPSSSELAWIAGACALLALLSLADLVVVLRRRRRERQRLPGRPDQEEG
ncbi:DUF6343 family protein [Streptomyces sp. Da 82-17]|uniref:DUF6343 family protein n=1 Tax=Streptomyces sp. Da 82-17 TaxID=3377116 RepID=UPI0038D37021